MVAEEILEALENGELSLSTEDIQNIVVQAVTKDEHINCDILKDLVKSINAVKKTAKKDYEEVKKEINAADKAKIASRAKAYWETLKEGDAISWESNGQICVGTVGVNKKGSKRAHCILNEIPANSKAKEPKADRYVMWEKIDVPEDFVMEENTEKIA